MTMSPAVMVAVMFGALFVAVIGSVFLGEHVTLRRTLGAQVMVAGVMVLRMAG